MSFSDPRYMTHSITVQRLPSTFANPKKRLSHTSKVEPSARTVGAFFPMAERQPIIVIRRRRKR